MRHLDFYQHEYLIAVSDLVAGLCDVTLIGPNSLDDFAIGRIPHGINFDLYGVSLNDLSKAPSNSFFANFRVLFGSRGVSVSRAPSLSAVG